MTLEELALATIDIGHVTDALERLALHATYADGAADVNTIRRFMKPHVDAELFRIRETARAMKSALLDAASSGSA